MEQIQLDIQPKDTQKLQLASVVQFMQQLQYDWDFFGKVFYSSHPINKGRLVIRLRTAIDLHNGNYQDWGGQWLRNPFEDVPVMWLLMASNKKTVVSANLQHSRKKGIVCWSHWVKFADTENGELFKSKFM